MKHIFLFAIGIWLFQSAFSQIYLIEAHLPPVLKADAGSEKSIALGDSIQLGGTPAAKDGYGGYIFLWTPSVGLSDATSPNPWAKPHGKSVYTLTVTDGHHCTSMDDVLVNVSGTGTNPEELPVSLQVYPNPADGVVNLSIGGFHGVGNIRIINTLGQKVYESEIHYINNQKIEIDVSRWQNGLYQFVVQLDKQLFTRIIMVN